MFSPNRPDFEGPALTDGFTDPIHSFSHENGTPLSCAIVGGDVYQPDIFATNTFPSAYIGKFFAADLCNNWVFTLDIETGELEEFYDESDALPTDRKGGNTLDLRSSPDGALWQLRRDKVDGINASFLYKIEYIGSGAPFIDPGARKVDDISSSIGSAGKRSGYCSYGGGTRYDGQFGRIARGRAVCIRNTALKFVPIITSRCEDFKS